MSRKSWSVGIVGIVGVALLAGGWYIVARSGTARAGELDNFARCLAAKGATMYGADWCGHCQNEKRAFGKSFQFVPYVECPVETAVCLEKKIEGYPTWILADGTRLEGEQGIEKLSAATACALP